MKNGRNWSFDFCLNPFGWVIVYSFFWQLPYEKMNGYSTVVTWIGILLSAGALVVNYFSLVGG